MRVATRPGADADVDNALALNQRSQPAVNGLTRDQLTEMIANSAYFGVVEFDHCFAGFVLTFLPDTSYQSENLSWFKQRYHDFLYLDRVAVADFARRFGCGAALYRNVERYCQQNTIANIALEVNLRPLNQASLDFHAQLGFKEVGRQDTACGTKTVSLMMKAVTS